MNIVTTGEENAQNIKSHDVLVRVRYAPMKQPYIEQRADRSETLATVKARAMEHFHLSEGPVDGGSKAYSLSFEDVIQTNLSVTLGELAKHHELALLLVEQFTQG